MTHPQQPVEIELKFALPGADAQALARRLAALPLLARVKPRVEPLHNVYFDDAEQSLRKRRTALRLRRIGGDGAPHWVQTLKIGAVAESALSRRGEWEHALPDGTLDQRLLQTTPWAELDPHGKLFAALAPVFTTHFERRSWLLKRPDGSRVEVALDIGEVSADGRSTPLCELELELLDGAPDALFDTARHIARRVPLLPLAVSKAERGYRLAWGTLLAPVRAHPPELSAHWPLPRVANTVIREMFLQFCANLVLLPASNDPEVVHQARVGWRRLRSALKFFGQRVDLRGMPPREPLRLLLDAIARQRDLDVAATETLPKLAEAYAAGDPARWQRWQALCQTLEMVVQGQRQAVRDALADPQVGLVLLDMTRWLESPWCERDDDGPAAKTAVADWARRRIRRLLERMDIDAQASDEPAAQHELRILSKRLRYCVEVLLPLLPRRRAERWQRSAAELQTRIGADRDLLLAADIVEGLQAPTDIVGFLRGVACGKRLA